jgi:hypothetical protein
MLRGALASAELVEVVLDELDGVVVPGAVQVLVTELLEALGGRGGSGVVELLGVLLLFVVVVLELAAGGVTLRDGRSSFCPSAIISPVSLFSVFTSSIHWRSCVSGTFCAVPIASNVSPDFTV